MKNLFTYSIIIILLAACQKDDNSDKIIDNSNCNGPTAYTLSLEPHFVYINPPSIPVDNPLTVEGIELGKRLFFEKKLSKNNELSCSSCHIPEYAFNDKDKSFSTGVNGLIGERNAMPLFNLAFNITFQDHGSFNWDGSANSIEEQAFIPVSHPLEMQESWPNVVSKLQNDPTYPPLFEAAFLTPVIDSVSVVKALAQFERTLISGNSTMDNEIKKEYGFDYTGPTLNGQERRGYEIYSNNSKGDCTHCHGDIPNPLFTDLEFHNNGLDLNPDSGLALVTKKASDVGKFKTPSLRNLVFTAPFMHDGRFATIEEVVNFYSDSVNANSTNIDGLMFDRGSHVANLNIQEKADLVAFLRAITDSSFVQNPNFRKP